MNKEEFEQAITEVVEMLDLYLDEKVEAQWASMKAADGARCAPMFGQSGRRLV